MQYFIKDLKFFKLDLSELAIWTKVYDSIKIQYVGSEQMNSKLGDLGFDYSSSVICYFGLEATIILALIAHLLFFLFSLIIDVYNDIQEYFKKMKNNQEYKPKWMMLFLIKTWRFFNRGFYISTFFESFLFLTICCLSEIANFSEESLFSWLSLLWAWLIILFEIGFWTYWFYNILKAVSLDDYYGPNESFFKGLKYRKSSARKYHIAFILRRTVIAFAAVFIHSRYLQFALYSVANFLHLGYILFELPFENIIDNMVYWIADASIWAIGLIYWLFISNGDSINYTQQDMSNYGVIIWWIILITDWLIFIILSINLAIESYNQIDKWIKQWRNRSKDKQNKYHLRPEQDLSANIENESKINKDVDVGQLSEFSNQSNLKSIMKNQSMAS